MLIADFMTYGCGFMIMNYICIYIESSLIRIYDIYLIARVIVKMIIGCRLMNMSKLLLAIYMDFRKKKRTP